MITVIDNINTVLKDTLHKLQPATNIKAYSLVESVAIRGDEDVTFPAIITPEGECVSVYSETDKHHVTLYHRLNSASFQESDNGGAVGDMRGYIETDDMSLIVFGKRERISQFRMEQIARKAIASNKRCALASSDFNALQVFASEYVGVTYFITPAYFLFKINYRIISTYNARCAKIE